MHDGIVGGFLFYGIPLLALTLGTASMVLDRPLAYALTGLVTLPFISQFVDAGSDIVYNPFALAGIAFSLCAFGAGLLSRKRRPGLARALMLAGMACVVYGALIFQAGLDLIQSIEAEYGPID